MTINIAIADDHPVVLHGLAALISSDPEFVVVAQCQNGVAALTAIRDLKPDLAILDLNMPGLNGIETVRRARERWPGLRVLYVTGYADAASTGLQTDDDPLIRKPFRLSELTAEVNRALERNRYAGRHNVVPLGRGSRKRRKVRDGR